MSRIPEDDLPHGSVVIAGGRLGKIVESHGLTEGFNTFSPIKWVTKVRVQFSKYVNDTEWFEPEVVEVCTTQSVPW